MCQQVPECRQVSVTVVVTLVGQDLPDLGASEQVLIATLVCKETRQIATLSHETAREGIIKECLVEEAVPVVFEHENIFGGENFGVSSNEVEPIHRNADAFGLAQRFRQHTHPALEIGAAVIRSLALALPKAAKELLAPAKRFGVCWVSLQEKVEMEWRAKQFEFVLRESVGLPAAFADYGTDHIPRQRLKWD